VTEITVFWGGEKELFLKCNFWGGEKRIIFETQ